MTTTATRFTAKKDLWRRIRRLSDKETEEVLRFIDDIESYDPNEETIAAFKEGENPDNLEICTDLQDMLKKCGIR